MRSRWNDADARAAIDRWGPAFGEDLALRTYTSRLIGADPDLVLHGGGNTSLKRRVKMLCGDEVAALFVKGSGVDLGSLDPRGLTALRLEPLERLRGLEALSEADMINELRINRLDGTAPAPSVETLLHAFLPHAFIDHSHANALLCLSNQLRGEELLRQAAGPEVLILPYITPGFPLAREVARAYEARPQAAGIIVAKHGLFTFANDARTAYERHISIVDACEQYLARRRPARPLTPSYRTEAPAEQLAARAAPILRGLLAERTGDEDRPYRRWVLEWRGDSSALEFANSAEAEALAATGPLTPDHVIRTRAFSLYVRDPAWGDESRLRQQFQQAVEGYAARYEALVGRCLGDRPQGCGSDRTPRVVFLPGAGVFCFGRSKKEAAIAADITAQGMRIKAAAHALNGYEAASDEHLCEMEYWNLQRAKLGAETERPLERQVVLVTGAAGAIGFGIAKVCAEAGAHVICTDIDEAGVARVVRRLEEAHGGGIATGIAMNVTDPASVRAGFDEACRRYGGVDVVVPNAGIAHVSPVADLAAADLQKVMAVNFLGTFLTIQEGARVLRAQGLGGHIVINSSKNVFGPGKDFGAYSASKAAGHQIGKVAAIELAAEGIRVNMVNADAIFGEEDVHSGLWATVGPDRARSRGMKLEDLPEYYRGRNLLHTRVRARHVGNAVVFFASNQTPTTGATLPVDGGVVEAFPR